MTEKRFELKVNKNNQYDIIDLAESKEKNALCVYNDLGNYYFSSAKALCELLNELNDECEFLEIENESLEHSATKYVELYHELLKENDELKRFKQKIFDLINRKIDECEEDYNRAVQAGMPSMIIYDEIEVLEWLKKELKE